MSDDEDVETFIQNQQKKRKQDLQQEMDRWDDMSERYNNPDPLHKLLQERIDLLKTKNAEEIKKIERDHAEEIKKIERDHNNDMIALKLSCKEDEYELQEENDKLEEQNLALKTQNDALYGELHEIIRNACQHANEMFPQKTQSKSRQDHKERMKNDPDPVPRYGLQRRQNNIAMEEFKTWTQKISKQFEQREKPRVCTICLDKPLTHAVMPCGHKCMCGDCAAKLTSKVCPICKDEYIKIGQIYE